MKEIFCILFSPRTDTDRLLSCKFHDCFSCYVFDIYCPLLVFNVLSCRSWIYMKEPFFSRKNFSLKQNNYNSCTECMHG